MAAALILIAFISAWSCGALAASKVEPVHSLVLKETTTMKTPRGEIRTKTTLWYQAPRRWRTETISPGQARPQLFVSDGTDTWLYNPRENTVSVNRLHPGQNALSRLLPFGRDVTNLQELLRRARTCADVTMQDGAHIAGRATYVLDLTPTPCPGPVFKRRLWVDKATLLALKEIRYHPNEQVELESQVSSIQYDAPIDPAVFTFTPPPGAEIYDYRPQQPPSPGAYTQRLEEIARRVDFPLFVPRWLPPGYVPLAPRRHPFGVELIYAPASEAGPVSPETPHSLNILQRKATPTDAARVPERFEPLRVGGAAGWFQAGRRQRGSMSTSLLTVMRDGTWIALSSFQLSKEEMLRVAQSMAPVAHGRPPLPNPTPRTLAQVRQPVSFPVFIPTDLPAGLTAEPPVGGERPDDPVIITYHTSDGASALEAMSGPAGCCVDADPRHTGKPVRVRGNIPAHFLPGPPEFGGPILWWHEDGLFLALSGPQFGEAELVRMAASMSSTVELGRTELPPARPKPKPVPSPTTDAAEHATDSGQHRVTYQHERCANCSQTSTRLIETTKSVQPSSTSRHVRRPPGHRG